MNLKSRPARRHIPDDPELNWREKFTLIRKSASQRRFFYPQCGRLAVFADKVFSAPVAITDHDIYPTL